MSRSTRTQRRAFTLFELLVVLALLVLLLGLLLPLVQRVREAAARTQCSNNLHLIVLSMHDFDSQNGTLPPAVGPMPNAPGDGTVFFHLLPYLERDPLFKEGRDGAGDPSPWGGGVYAKPVQTFLCPSDGTGGPDHLYRGWLATSSYAGNYLLFGTGGAAIARIPDGTSNTFAFTERYQICNDQPCDWAYSGESEWAPVFAFTNYGMFQIAPAQTQCDPALPQSVHRGGIQAAMCDGSVRTVSSGIRPQTWYYACTPNGGEVLGDDW